MVRIEWLREVVERLAALERESCSPGEHEAAEWIAARLREQGWPAAVEYERVHGSYWWPLGATSAIGLLAAGASRRGGRIGGAILGVAGALLAVDDLTIHRRWLRAMLPKRLTANVVALAGDPDADQTLVVVAHHDAAHTGIFFNPRLAERVSARGRDGDRPHDAPRVMIPIVAGPLFCGAGALLRSRALAWSGALCCAGIILSFANIARSRTVPGANDNLTGVAVVLALGRELRERPVRGLRVLLVSTGAEESLMEGMRAFAARHFPTLSPARTRVLCVDTVGSPQLVLAAGEGMLRTLDHDQAFAALIADCARSAGIQLVDGVRMRLGTDGYVALRHGFPAALLMSVNEFGVAANYHWPTDTPDRVDYDRVLDAVRLCDAALRRIGSATP